MSLPEKHKSYESLYLKTDNYLNLNSAEFKLRICKLGYRFFVRSNNCLTESIFKLGYAEYSGNAKEVLDWTDENFKETWAFAKRDRQKFFYMKNKEDALKFILKYGCEKLEEL